METRMISRTFYSRCPGLASMAALGGLMLGCGLPYGTADAAVLQLVTILRSLPATSSPTRPR
jgi:hypothetical protein